jgi:hypothetical protein
VRRARPPARRNLSTGNVKASKSPERVPIVPTAGQPLAGIARGSARTAACTT